MIFVTVGTHEQAFNRLVEYMDKWAGAHDEEVIMQTGYSTYKPKHCKWSDFYSYQDMVKMVDEARIIITHGGPSSFIMSLQVGKIPIVVPRKKELDEHVNNHQVDFCNQVAKRQCNIIVVEEIKQLGDILARYDVIVHDMQKGFQSHNATFCAGFEKIVSDLMGK